MIKIAERKYKDEPSMKKSEKVQAFFKDVVFVRQKDVYKHKTDSYEDWLLELEADNMVKLLKVWKTVLRPIFDEYSSKTLVMPVP